MDDINRVEVVIGGEIITLLSDEKEEYMQRLAHYIDRKLAEMKTLNSNATINERRRTVFIAVNIADDYFKTLEKNEALELKLDKFTLALGQTQEENIILKEKLKELQNQLNQTRNEAEAYINGGEADQNNIVAFMKNEPKPKNRKTK